MSRILETNNYKKFVLSPFNRDVKKTRWLRESLLKWGWIKSKPLDCRRRADDLLEIRDGHHRFVLAMELGIMVCYVETTDGATAHDLNKTIRHWDLQDYLTSRTREAKNAAYTAVEKYVNQTGINLSLAVSLLGGHSVQTGRFLARFKDGTFSLGDQTHAKLVGDIVVHCKSLGIPFARNNLFVQSISKILWVKELDRNVLKERIARNLEVMKKQVSQKDYILLLEEVYNRGSRRRIALAFLAEEAARKRNAVTVGREKKHRAEGPDQKSSRPVASTPGPVSPQAA